MFAYRAILSRIYRLKLFFSNCKMSLYSDICFVFYITDMFQSLFLLVPATFKNTLNLHKN